MHRSQQYGTGTPRAAPDPTGRPSPSRPGPTSDHAAGPGHVARRPRRRMTLASGGRRTAARVPGNRGSFGRTAARIPGNIIIISLHSTRLTRTPNVLKHYCVNHRITQTNYSVAHCSGAPCNAAARLTLHERAVHSSSAPFTAIAHSSLQQRTEHGAPGGAIHRNSALLTAAAH